MYTSGYRVSFKQDSTKHFKQKNDPRMLHKPKAQNPTALKRILSTPTLQDSQCLPQLAAHDLQLKTSFSRGFWVQGFWGSGLGVWGLGCRGFGFKVEGFGVWWFRPHPDQRQ